MYQVKMLKTLTGSTNGRDCNVYHKDNVYIIPTDLYNSFIKMAVCELVENKPIIAEVLEAVVLETAEPLVLETAVIKTRRGRKGKK